MPKYTFDVTRLALIPHEEYIDFLILNTNKGYRKLAGIKVNKESAPFIIECEKPPKNSHIYGIYWEEVKE